MIRTPPEVTIAGTDPLGSPTPEGGVKVPPVRVREDVVPPGFGWFVGGTVRFPSVIVRCDKSGPVLDRMPPMRMLPKVSVGGIDPLDSPTPPGEVGLPPVRVTEDVVPPGLGWLVGGTIRFPPAKFRLDESYLVLALMNTT